MKKEKNQISRRDFLKRLGVGVAATSIAAAGCKNKNNPALTENTINGDIPKDKMTYRTNPKSGEKVSLLGYGCMRWPTIINHDNGTPSEKLDQEMINRLVDKAIAHGVNYFDTSPAYCQGQSERATGIALSRYPRNKYYIATKLSNFGRSTWSREESLKMYHNSFKELQVDYIDYYLLHNIGASIDIFNQRFIDNGMLDLLIEERKAGRIRNLGWSFHGKKEVFNHILAYHEKVHWDFIQIQMNYQDWEHANNRNVNAEYLYAELEKRNIPAIIMEPLLGGRLSKVPTHIANRLKQREPERSVASWAFRFVGSYPMVLTALSGMTYMEHLQDNLHSFAPLVPLTEDEKEFLFETATLMDQYPTIPCNDCKYCMPCPYGLDIPAILLHYNKCVNEGNLPNSSRDENYAKARRAFLIGYDRSVPRLRQADHCIDCDHCLPHCPQNIAIPQEMQRIHAFVETLKQNKEF